MIWLSGGIVIGILNGLTLRWTVGRLRPEASLIGVPLVAVGYFLRLGLAAGLLIIALQRDIVPGLLAMTGLWLARWITIYNTLPRRSRTEPMRR
jgi:hypothetical protein